MKRSASFYVGNSGNPEEINNNFMIDIQVATKSFIENSSNSFLLKVEQTTLLALVVTCSVVLMFLKDEPEQGRNYSVNPSIHMIINISNSL